MSARVLVLFLTAALTAACAAATDAPPPAREDLPNVLLLTVDTLRVDRLGVYGGSDGNSPRLDGLAGAGVRYSQVQAPRGLTWPSLTTIMTGLYPRTHKVRLNGGMLAEEFVTLPEVLRDAGYDTGGFISNMCDAPNRGLETFYCAWPEEEKETPPGTVRRRRWATEEQPIWDRAITDEADAFIRRQRDRPFFAWVHYIDPHKPYNAVERFLREEYDGSFVPEDEVLAQRTLDEVALTDAEMGQLLAVYDSQVASTDAHIGRLLDTLDELGLTGDTLVVFSADHGEELGDHNFYFYHLASVYQQVLAVPWILRWPGHLPAGRVVAEQVELNDLAPTVLDLLELPAPAGVEGASRRGLANGEADATGADVVYSEWQDRMVVVGKGRWRFVWNPYGQLTEGRPFTQREDRAFHIGKLELYDLDTDPLQQLNVADEHQGIVEEMRALACRFVLEKPFTREAESAVPDDVRRRLEALGYVQDTDVPDDEAGLARYCRDEP